MGTTIIGAAEVERKLREMGRKDSTKLIRNALREGAEPIKNAASADAPHKSGLLGSAMKISNGRTRADLISVKVTPSKAKLLSGKNKFYYAASQNDGWFSGARLKLNAKGNKFGGKAEYSAASKAAGRSFHEGQHFMERAFAETRGEAMEIAANAMAEGIIQNFKS